MGIAQRCAVQFFSEHPPPIDEIMKSPPPIFAQSIEPAKPRRVTLRR